MEKKEEILTWEEALRYECDAVENLTYQRPLKADERERMMSRVVELNAEILRVSDEKRDAIHQFSERIGELRDELKGLLIPLQSGQIEKTEDCFRFTDEEDGEYVTYYLDKDGKEVFHRKATADELQKTINSALREQKPE